MGCCARCLRGSLGGWAVAHAVYVVVLVDGLLRTRLRGSLDGWAVAHAVYVVVLVDGLLRTLSTW